MDHKIEFSVETLLALYALILPPHHNKWNEFVLLVNHLTGSQCSGTNIEGLMSRALDARRALIDKAETDADIAAFLRIAESEPLPAANDTNMSHHWLYEMLKRFSREMPAIPV